jgi:hypothetical protein
MIEAAQFLVGPISYLQHHYGLMIWNSGGFSLK